MAAFFVNASSQRILNSASPITAAPFTVGLWVRPNQTASTRSVFTIVDTGASNHDWRLFQNGSTSWQFGARAGGTYVAASAGVPVASTWFFCVCREISATSRRLSVFSPAGAVHGASAATSRVPLNIDTISIGSTEGSTPSLFFDGHIAEFWYTQTDIQGDGAQLNNALLLQLAYGGPFSNPKIAKDIKEYRSLRVYPDSKGDNGSEVYCGAGLGRQTWTNTNGVTTGPHPPLPYWYVKPGQVKTQLVI